MQCPRIKVAVVAKWDCRRYRIEKGLLSRQIVKGADSNDYGTEREKEVCRSVGGILECWPPVKPEGRFLTLLLRLQHA